MRGMFTSPRGKEGRGPTYGVLVREVLHARCTLFSPLSKVFLVLCLCSRKATKFVTLACYLFECRRISGMAGNKEEKRDERS